VILLCLNASVWCSFYCCCSRALLETQMNLKLTTARGKMADAGPEKITVSDSTNF
jgi:hypothetical protein